MCEIKSALVLKDRMYFPFDHDDHSKMIQELKLDDTTKEPQFVRVEIRPIDNNIFNHDLSNWKLKVDQDFKPDWFSEKHAEEEAKEYLPQWFSQRFALGKVEEINSGRWFIGKNAQVKYIYDSAQVENISGSAQVEYIYDSAQVENISGSAQVENIYDSAQVENIYDSAQVENIYGSAQVKYIYGSAQVKYIYGSAQVGEIKDKAICKFTSNTAKYKTIEDNGMAILYYTDNPVIVVANKKIQLKVFKGKKGTVRDG